MERGQVGEAWREHTFIVGCVEVEARQVDAPDLEARALDNQREELLALLLEHKLLGDLVAVPDTWHQERCGRSRGYATWHPREVRRHATRSRAAWRVCHDGGVEGSCCERYGGGRT